MSVEYKRFSVQFISVLSLSHFFLTHSLSLFTGVDSGIPEEIGLAAALAAKLRENARRAKAGEQGKKVKGEGEGPADTIGPYE